MSSRLAALGGITLGVWLLAALASAQDHAHDEPADPAQGEDWRPYVAPPPEAPADTNPQPPAAPAPDNNPYQNARRTRARANHRWTHADVLRIRAELAAQRAAVAAHDASRAHDEESGGPRVYGDAGAAFTVGLELLAVFRNDIGFQHFARHKSGQRLGVFASFDVLTLAPKVIASAELGAGFESDTANGLLGPGTSGDLDSQTLHAGVQVRWDALPFLSPLARLWGGVSLFQLDTSGSEPAFETEHAASGFGALGGGILLHTPARTFENRTGHFASLGLGVLIEGGYALRLPIDFSLHAPNDGRSIRVIDAELGRLSLSGAYVRSSVVVRF